MSDTPHTDPLPDDVIAEGLRLASEATELPWDRMHLVAEHRPAFCSSRNGLGTLWSYSARHCEDIAYASHACTNYPAVLRELQALRAEVERLMAGQFTAEEIHTICHNLHGTVDARRFASGCTTEQRKLYGCAPDADEVQRLAQLLWTNGICPTTGLPREQVDPKEYE